jgi:predicted RecA/RadA family phage recombinase
MARNRKFANGRQLAVVCNDPATPASGDPVRWGKIGGVALIAENADGETVVDFGPAVYTLPIFDEATGGVLVGGEVWYDDTGAGSPSTKLTNLTTGAEAFFGYSMTALGNGVTGNADILVSRRGL